jgi:hypothetical protein
MRLAYTLDVVFNLIHGVKPREYNRTILGDHAHLAREHKKQSPKKAHEKAYLIDKNRRNY